MVVSNVVYLHPDPWGNDPIDVRIFQISGRQKSKKMYFVGMDFLYDDLLWAL